jgi:hypothetical protein
MSPKQCKKKDSRNRTRSGITYGIDTTSNEIPSIYDPINSSVLPVYIHYALGHGAKIAVALNDIYNPKSGQVADNVFEMLKNKLLRHGASITKGWIVSIQDGLTEALKRNDLCIHAKLGASDELLLGTSQEHIVDSGIVFKMAYSSTAPLLIIVRVDGFVENAPADPDSAATPFSMRHNTSQFLAPRIVIKLPTGDVDNAGNPTEEEVYSMEPKLNAKDFMKAESINMRDMGEAMQWYHILATHGSVNGVFIPPSVRL